MKKGEKTPERITVERKPGDVFILQPGHKVFQCDLNSGIVKEHKLKVIQQNMLIRFLAFIFRKKLNPIYKTNESETLLTIPAFDIHKARVRFKHMTSDLKGFRVK